MIIHYILNISFKGVSFYEFGLLIHISSSFSLSLGVSIVIYLKYKQTCDTPVLDYYTFLPLK